MRMLSLNRIADSRPSGRARVMTLLIGGLLALISIPGSANVIQVARAATGPGGSQCSLIDAINAANNNKATGACPAGDDATNGGDVILLAAGTYKVTTADNDWYGPNGLPAITSRITIIGDPQGTIIMRDSSQGGSALRIFYIGGGKSLTGYNPPTDSSGNPVYTSLPGPGNLTLQNLTLQNGLAQGGDGGKGDPGNGGGGLGAGGAIYNQGTLVLQGVTLNGNQAIGGDGGGSSTSTSSSGSPGGGGGMSGKGDGFGNGGGFSSNGSWPDSSSAPGTFGNGGDSRTTGGVGGGGGAAKNGGFGGGGGGNAGAGGFGGGGGNLGQAGFGGGTGILGFDGGGAGLGGAIFNDGGTVTILNSTLTANNAQGGAGGVDGFSSGSGYGGAIFNLNGKLTIRYSTLVANTVTFNQNLINFGSDAAGGAVYNYYLANPGSPAANASSTASLTIDSSILYNSNQVTLSSTDTSAAAIDCINTGGSFTGSNNNIGALSTTCAAGSLTSPSLLLALGNYGGPTQTMQLLGGAALNSGNTSTAPSLDQRGYLRDVLPDIGAYENSYIRIAPPTVTGLQDATVFAATGVGQYPFNIAGSQQAPAGLTVSVNSSDTSLLPIKNISVSSGCGSGTSQAACSLSITPPTDKTGSVTLTVTVTDSYGQLGYQSFVLTIIPPPPVASDVSLSTASNQDLASTLKATEALNAQLSYSIVSQPSNGTVKLTSAGSSAFTYTANTGFTGKDSFTFKANDGSSDSNVATVTITVTAPVAIPGQLTASNLSLTVYQNTTATGTLSILGGSGQGLTISIGTKPAHGTVTITDANSGAFTYTPKSGYVGTDSFTYSAKDNTLDTTSNTATVSITVNAVSTTGVAAPIASKLSLVTYAGIPVSGKLTASDAAGNPVSYAITQPAHGTLKLSDANTGAFTYTPATGFTGADSFTFTATDTATKLTSSAATVSLTVSAIPISGSAVPLANNAAFTTYANVQVNASLSASDAAGNALNYVLAQPPTHGTVTITAATGAFVYTPTTSYTGKDNFTFTATDTSSSVSSKAATVSLTINALPPPASTAPIANDVSLKTYESLPVSGTLTASDASGNPLTYAITAQPGHSTAPITLTGGAFTYTPAAPYTGNDSFTYTATDTVTGLVSAPATVSIIVNSTPTAPAAPATGTLTLDTYQDVAISGTLPATDALGTPLTYAIDATPASGNVTPFDPSTGTFTYTPNAGYIGSDNFTFTATNTLTGATSAAATVSITVTDPTTVPTPIAPLASGGTISLYENTPASGTLIAADNAGNPLTYAVGTQPAHGTVSVTAATGAFTYTPTPGYTGSDSFTFTAKDTTSGQTSAAATISLTISTAPPPPAAPLVSGENLTLYQNQSVTGNLSAVAASGDPVTYSVIQPTHGTLTLTAATGAFTYTPTAGYTGTDSFSYTALDTAINTVSASATVSLTINSLPLTSPNPMANGASLSLYADQPLTGTLLAVDIDANPLTYAVATQPTHGMVNVTATSGAFTYTPDAGYTGNDSFTFTATDTVTNQTSEPATLSLAVNAVPTPPAPATPLANDLNIASYADQAITSTLSASEANSNPLVFAVTVQPAHGTVAVTPSSGGFVYTPDSGYIGKDSFDFTVTDTVASLTSSTATVSIAILSTASSSGAVPLANGATLSMYANQPLTGTLSAVDANKNPLSYAIATKPVHGKVTVTPATGAFTYTPAAGYVGKDSFTFTATDTVTNLASTDATVSLAISSPTLAEVAPLASDADLTLYANQSLSSTLSAVDANGNSLSYAVGTKPKNGTVSVTADTGAFVYTPTAGYTGTDSFTFIATDTTSKLASSAATVSLTIEPAPPTPTHHGGPGGGGLGLVSLLILIPLLSWRRFTVKAFPQRLFHTSAILAGLLLSFLGGTAHAQDASSQNSLPADAWYVGGQAGIIKPDKKRNASTHGFRGWGLLFGKEFGDYSLEFSGAYHADSPRTTTDIASWTSFGANGSWYFLHRNTSWFSPFAYAGLGLTNQYKGDNTKVKSQYLSLGAGFDSTFGQQLPIRVRTDLQLQHVFTGYNDLILSIGVVFPFGGSTPAWQPAPPPANSPLDEYPMPWCTDKGGHPYHSDQGWVCLPPAAAPPKPDCDAKAAADSDSAVRQTSPGCPPG